MFVRFGLLRRSKGMDAQAFREHWANSHAPLVSEALPHLRGYVQNVVTEAAQRSIDFDRLPIQIDGMSQLYFDDLASAGIQRDDPQYQTLREDEGRFLDGVESTLALQNVVIPPNRLPPKALKRMAFLRRHPGVSVTDFRQQWFGLHATLVSRIPGVIGYRQNLVLEHRAHGSGANVGSPDTSIDGIVELWFAGLEEIEAGFRSQQGITVMTHAQEFICQISTYLVDPLVILPEPEEAFR